MPLQQSSSPTDFSHGQAFGQGNQGGKNNVDKNKGAGKGPGIPVPDVCQVFVDSKQFCKKGAEWKVRRKRHVLEQAMPGTPSGQCVPTRTSFDTVTTA